MHYEDVTVRLTEHAAQAMRNATALTEHALTDTINRALILYNEITQEAVGQRSQILARRPDGTVWELKFDDLA